jgi:hypothetical protein
MEIKRYTDFSILKDLTSKSELVDLYDSFLGENSDLYLLPMGTITTKFVSYVMTLIYLEFEDDRIAYTSFDDFKKRLFFDLTCSMPFILRKYNEYLNLLNTSTTPSLNVSSSMHSQSNEDGHNASGFLQKTASTPTGVSTGTTEDVITIDTSKQSGSAKASIETDGFVDKYTNFQGKSASSSSINNEKITDIERKGSTKDLLDNIKRLEFELHNEILGIASKHFLVLYEDKYEDYLYM